MLTLELENVFKSYPSSLLGKRYEVLKGLSLSISQGEVFGFLGHNGAGKTTTIKLILGFLKPDSGRICVFGSTGVTLAAKSRIGYLSENTGLYSYLTAEEMLEFTGRLCNLSGSVIKARKKLLLDMVGLSSHAATRIKNFSKGMRQRLGIAVAIVNDPDLLLLDEPYSGLDPLGRKLLKDIFLSLKKEGKTILMSSHIAPDVEAVCDRVGILKDGKIARFLDLKELHTAGGGEVEVSASGVQAESIEKMIAGVKVIECKGDFALLKCEGEEILKALLSAVYTCGGRIHEIKRAKPTLEECLVETLKGGSRGRSGVDYVEEAATDKTASLALPGD